MKTLSRILMITALLALTAAPAAAGGGAAVYTYHEGDPDWQTESLFYCLGDEPGELTEMVALHINYTAVIHGTITPSGAYNSLYNETNDFWGIGVDTGNRYEGHYTWHVHFTGRVGSTVELRGPIVWRNLDTGQTMRGLWMIRITTNANGTVTTERVDDWPNVTCLH